MITSVFLLICYAVAFPRLIALEECLPLTPHWALKQKHNDLALRVTIGLWMLVFATAVSCSFFEQVSEFGQAAFVIGAVLAFLSGGYDILRSRAPAKMLATVITAPKGRVLSEGGPRASDVVRICEDLYASAEPVTQTDLSSWLPERMYVRILGAQELLKNQLGDLTSKNLQLNTLYHEWFKRGEDAEAEVAKLHASLEALQVANAQLRSRSSGEEKPFPAMTSAELNLARDRRETEIIQIDKQIQARATRKKPGPDNNLPLNFQ